MGLMKKAARRATPRPVRKAKSVVKHPVGTAARAVTPRSLRKAKRTGFNVTHPLNTAENALLNAATPKRTRRRATPAGSSSRTAAVASRSTTNVETQQASAFDRARCTTDPSRGGAFRVARPTDDEVYVVLVAAGRRAREVADFIRRDRFSFGPWNLKSAEKMRRRAARKRVAAPPVFLLANKAPAELGRLMIAAYAELGATVQLWVDAAEPGGTTQAESHSAQPQADVSCGGQETRAVFPQRVTTAWMKREVPGMSPPSFDFLLDMLVERGWTDEEIKERVLPLRTV